MLSGWQGREAIVSYAMQQIHHVPSPWFTKWARWHCPVREKWWKSHLPLPAPNGSEASKNFAGKSLERRRTHTRSVVIVAMNREKCGRWMQICKNIFWYVVLVQSAPWRLICLILNNWSTLGVNENTFQLYSASFLLMAVWWQFVTIQLGLRLQNQKAAEWYKWHQPKIWEIERSEARLTLAQMRFAETKKSPWQWAVWSKRLGNTGMLPLPKVLSRSKPRIWMSSFSKHAPSHVCHRSAGVSFCNSSAWGQMLSESKYGKQVGEHMLGLRMVECSNVATQHKRPCFADPGRTNLQEMEDLIWPQSILWTH